MSEWISVKDRLPEKERELERLRRVEQILKFTVIGWRERDWPEGFDRRTAGVIADAVGEQLAALDNG